MTAGVMGFYNACKENSTGNSDFTYVHHGLNLGLTIAGGNVQRDKRCSSVVAYISLDRGRRCNNMNAVCVFDSHAPFTLINHGHEKHKIWQFISMSFQTA
jgi:hypothetical protein